MKQITRSLTEECKSYAWHNPEVVAFKASDGAEVYGRLYKPAIRQPDSRAVIFVHRADCLQNAHKFWSQYFRQYMFYNLLAENGHTI